MVLIHPATGNPILIAAEMCYEHQIGLLPMMTWAKPLIQFILSDSTEVREHLIFAHITIPCDSIHPSKPIVSEAIYRYKIRVMKHNLYAPPCPLIPATVDDLPTRKESPLTSSSSPAFYTRSAKKYTPKDIISHWTILLANWVEAPSLPQRIKAGEEVRRFSKQYRGELPMNYAKQNGERISLVEHAMDDRQLQEELKGRASLQPVSSPSSSMK